MTATRVTVRSMRAALLMNEPIRPTFDHLRELGADDSLIDLCRSQWTSLVEKAVFDGMDLQTALVAVRDDLIARRSAQTANEVMEALRGAYLAAADPVDFILKRAAGFDSLAA
jgi:hypothetical protein